MKCKQIENESKTIKNKNENSFIDAAHLDDTQKLSSTDQQWMTFTISVKG